MGDGLWNFYTNISLIHGESHLHICGIALPSFQSVTSFFPKLLWGLLNYTKGPQAGISTTIALPEFASFPPCDMLSSSYHHWFILIFFGWNLRRYVFPGESPFR